MIVVETHLQTPFRGLAHASIPGVRDRERMPFRTWQITHGCLGLIDEDADPLRFVSTMTSLVVPASVFLKFTELRPVWVPIRVLANAADLLSGARIFSRWLSR
jgi:hypothetical protein